jgi:dihydroorotate dehydrogenase
VAEVVAEADVKMSDPNYSAVMVGGFVQEQKAAAQYVGAHERDLGSPEAVVNAIFHAALIGEIFKRTNNRTVRAMDFQDLDHVSGENYAQRLKDLQPAIAEYIEVNVQSPPMRKVLQLLALAMDWVS